MCRFSSVFALLGALITAPSIFADYEVINIGTVLDRQSCDGRPGNINDHGQVVAEAYNTFFVDNAGFVWHNGHVTVLAGLPGSNLTASWAINRHGHIVGGSGPDNNHLHAVLWTRSGPIDMGTLGGRLFGIAYSLNNHDDAVGTSRDLDGTLRRAVLWHHGRAIDLGPGVAYAINDDSQVAGIDTVANRAFLWEDGKRTYLSDGPSQANWLNSDGQVVGKAEIDGQFHAVPWDDDMLDLGTLGGATSEAQFITDDCVILGTSKTEDGDDHAFLWMDGAMIDLNDLLPDDSGWTLLDARGMNTRGQITGTGLFRGDRRPYLLRPVH
jgi:probable HAF family extracellular repeat protein